MIPFTQPWFLAGLVFLAVALGAVTIAIVFELIRESRRRRTVLKHLKTGVDGLFETEQTDSLFRGRDLSEVRWIRYVAARFPRLGDVGQLLEQAAVPWSIQTFLVLSAGLAVGLGLVGLLLASPVVGAVCAALGALLPYMYVRRKKTVRVRRIEEQLPEAIDLLGRAIRAGHPLSAGLQMVADESPPPIGVEFRQVFEEQRFGLPVADSLMGLVDRVDLVDIRILVTAVLIQREVGGNLAEILDKIAHTIRARFTLRRQLRVYTAQGRFSGYVLAVLPIIVGSLIFLVSPDYMMRLFDEPAGQYMVGFAIVLQILGYLWIRRIVNIDI